MRVHGCSCMLVHERVCVCTVQLLVLITFISQQQWGLLLFQRSATSRRLGSARLVTSYSQVNIHTFKNTVLSQLTIGCSVSLLTGLWLLLRNRWRFFFTETCYRGRGIGGTCKLHRYKGTWPFSGFKPSVLQLQSAARLQSRTLEISVLNEAVRRPFVLR